MKKILGLIGDENAVSIYRIIQPLEKIGGEFISNDNGRKLVFGEIANEFKKYDVVIVKYLATKELVSHLLAASNEVKTFYNKDFKIYVDVDDAIFNIPKGNACEVEWTEEKKFVFKFLCQNVDGIICSTQPLADRMKKINPNVRVIPNKIKMSNWTDERRQRDEITIGWSFSKTHIPDIPIVREALQEIHKKYPQVKIETINGLIGGVSQPVRGCHFKDFPKQLEWYAWDIAIAPLKDNVFNACKSNIKWFESTMAGSAFVCSDVPAYASVEHGKTGLKCKTKKQWVKALSDLIESKELREELVMNAHEEVSKNWSVENDTDYQRLYDEL